MKRLALTVIGTVAGLAAVLSFKTQTHPLAGSAPLPTAELNTSSGSSSATSAPPTPGRTAGTPAASSTGSAAKSYRGTAVTTRYGIVQVKITVTNRKITNVSFVQLTAFDPHSAQINSFAGPQLLRETLSAQSAQVDTVSGASYTSDGYRSSLQSALDRAGL